MSIRLYNTLTRHMEPLLAEGTLEMFVCGPTVYDYAHIGNFRSFVVFDTIAKHIRFRGLPLFYLQNITDIDNKIIKRARESGVTPTDIALEYERIFLTDATRLKITAVDTYARASEHLPEIIAQVGVLIEKGYAYTAPAVQTTEPEAAASDGNQDVYFDVDAYEKNFPGEYGQLSGQHAGGLETGVRIDVENNKRSPRDFVIWKARNYTYEPAWQSPWGLGRPGWHIEDTAISEKYLGQQYDIHGGGQDLKFPHHEAEIAQQQAASDKTPFVRYWLHNGFLETKSEKMSKSLGNFITAHELLNRYSPEAIRLYLLSGHYRAPLDLSETALTQAEAGVMRIGEFIRRLHAFESARQLQQHGQEARARSLATRFADILDAMDEDFNTPKAIGIFFEILREVNHAIDTEELDIPSAGKLLSIFDFFDHVLGIVPRQTADIPPEIFALAKERQAAKDAGDYARSDALRDAIATHGYQIDDTPAGPVIKKR